MRVLQAMAGAEFGGAEAFFTRLAVALGKAGLDQRVLIRENRERAGILEAGGVDPVQLRFGGKLDLLTPLAFKREVRSFKPDIVLTWMNRATSMCPKAKDGEFLHVARLGGYYDLKYYQNCDHLIGNTEDIVDYLVKEGWPRDKAHYLPNFVSGDRSQPLPRQTFFTPDNAPLILGVGRLHENKAFDILLQAISRVPGVYLWIAGEGPKRKELEDLAEKLAVKPRVRFLGWRDDVASLLAASDVFVCSSRLEPLGNVVIEAWAQEIPVIAADSYGPGTLIDHLQSGVLFPVDDAPTLAKAIRNVLEDENLRTRIALQGRAAYDANFTERAVVGQYLEFFEKLSATCVASPVS